jgi:hypothetical protein
MAQEPSSQVQNYSFSSVQDNLVARGNSAATAFLLGTVDTGAMVNRFTSVPLGTGCLLPPAVAGLVITVINSGANPLQIYGGGDTINGISGVAGVPMMVNSAATFYCATTGAWFSVNLGSGFTTTAQGGAVPTFSTQSGVTASVTHSIAGGVPIVASQVELHVVANAGDAVTLPLAQPGMEITIVNNGALSAGVYPQATDQINGGGAGTPFTQVVGVTLYFCFTPNLWVTK